MKHPDDPVCRQSCCLNKLCLWLISKLTDRFRRDIISLGLPSTRKLKNEKCMFNEHPFLASIINNSSYNTVYVQQSVYHLNRKRSAVRRVQPRATTISWNTWTANDTLSMLSPAAVISTSVTLFHYLAKGSVYSTVICCTA